MTAFAERYGEWNSWHGNYKWQKLITAAEYYFTAHTGELHRALADALTTALVVKEMRTDVLNLRSETYLPWGPVEWSDIPGSPRARESKS